MTQWLIRNLVRNYTETASPKVRGAYGTLGSMTGILINVALSAVKFSLGLLSGSLAVTADAVNNLSDAAGSLMSLISVRLAEKPDDRRHPFGHGRMEYLGALGVGALITLAGLKLLADGVNGIITPEALEIAWPLAVVMGATVLVKLWLNFFYSAIAKTIDSQPLYAAAKDSLTDVVATSAVLVSLVLQMLFHWRVDGYMGVVVALFVLKTGISVCRDTIDRLLGGKPSAEMTANIREKMLTYPGILGVHDLVVHDYGPGRCIASVHAEVSATGDIVAVHEVIDQAERELKRDLGLTVCIHMDPTVTDDPTVNEVRTDMVDFLREQDERLTLHDFRMVPGQKQINLIFDCLLPEDYLKKDALREALRQYAHALDARYEVIVQFDTDFT